MIGQGQRDTVPQRLLWKRTVALKDDATIALEEKFIRIELAKSLDEVGLAVEGDSVSIVAGFDAIDPDRATASGCRGQIARLSPLQDFAQFADITGGFCGTWLAWPMISCGIWCRARVQIPCRPPSALVA